MHDHDEEVMAPLFKAIAATGLEIDPLEKGERNNHGGYSYASIDDFYRHVSAVAYSNGLSWSVREVSADVVIIGEKVVGGNTTLTRAFQAKYNFDLYHESGASIEDFHAITILHPLQGAQTAGSAMSYAVKQFMRTTFSVVTGEPDADATDNSVFDLGGSGGQRQNAGQAQPARQVVAQAPPREAKLPQPSPPKEVVEAKPTPKGDDVVAKGDEGPKDQDDPLIFMTETAKSWVAECKDPDQLTRYWIDNEATFKKIETKHPALYADLIATFSAQKSALKKTGAKRSK